MKTTRIISFSSRWLDLIFPLAHLSFGKVCWNYDAYCACLVIHSHCLVIYGPRLPCVVLPEWILVINFIEVYSDFVEKLEIPHSFIFCLRLHTKPFENANESIVDNWLQFAIASVMDEDICSYNCGSSELVQNQLHLKSSWQCAYLAISTWQSMWM